MINAASNVLVVAAHPDDEVLGCGGTIARLVANGATVHVAFLADGVISRHVDVTGSAELISRRKAAEEACSILGAQQPSFDSLPDNQLDSVPLLQIVKIVEQLLATYKPDTILTHHGGDLNIDHRQVHNATVTACRPLPGSMVRRLLFFEVASSTEWQASNIASAFTPNVFVDISQTLDKKLSALRAYKDEIRPWPHARSIEGVEYLARWRGASSGVAAAEAFMLGREIA